MPGMTAEEKLDFVLNILKNSTEFKPDYRKTATETGCANANKAQIKFKKIVDDTGMFTLTGGKFLVIGGEDDNDDDDASGGEVPTPKKPKGRGRPKKNENSDEDGHKASASKKRKLQSVDTEKSEE